jgi:hypothetical protein
MNLDLGPGVPDAPLSRQTPARKPYRQVTLKDAKHQSILIGVMAAALVVPAWAQQPAAAAGSAETQARRYDGARAAHPAARRRTELCGCPEDDGAHQEEQTRLPSDDEMGAGQFSMAEGRDARDLRSLRVTTSS